MSEIKMYQHPKMVFFLLVALVILFFLLFGLSFSILLYSKKGMIVNTIQTGNLTMTYTEVSPGISIQNALPMSDEKGKKLSGDNEKFKFSISSLIAGKVNIDYEIAAIKKDDNTLNDRYIKLYLEKSQDGVDYYESMPPKSFVPLKTTSSIGSPAGSMVLESGTFTKNECNYYLLRMWIDENANLPNEVYRYAVTVNVYGVAKKIS